MDEVGIILGAIGQVMINFLPFTILALVWFMYELGKELGGLGE